MARLRALIYVLFLSITVVPYAIACLLWAPLPRPWRYRLTVGWPRLGVWGARWILGIRWEVKGWENLPDGPGVILAKHQSTWETFFLISHMPREVCFVYKRELNRVPFFGWGLALLDMIAINRSNRREAFAQVLQQGKVKLEEGRWPLLFPEGTRTAPGTQGQYRQGGARLAIHSGVPVIPIAHNAGECWPKGAWVQRPGLVTISIGPLIDSTDLSAHELTTRTEAWIEAEMRRISPHLYAD